jgi:2-dehydropantoate 2-reductase
MRIAVIGAGGVGGAFGAALAKAGADVTFVARGAHLKAMRENGLRVEGGRGETLVNPAQAASGRSISSCSASNCGTWSPPGTP